ncbi:Maf family protein [Agarilytica rhodophyticola]|uniref:Maf family protein n=1 Tax=Agarilytica rhodophyticola TaxID=1737490 RepID=UPI000B3439F0|nr:nucleoside triphosphate pyrophosphatase [Agarilytica rhodophyticola]
MPQQTLAAKILLASSSPYRKQQLKQQLGLDVKTVAPDINESPLSDEIPKQTALRLSLLKAQAVASVLDEPHLIIAGDQTASFEGELLKKPMTQDIAHKQLQRFSGRQLSFFSGVCLLHSKSGEHLETVVETHVQFRHLSADQITYYLEYDKPFDCVGAFKNESLGITLLKSITSNDPSALTGLPLITLTQMLLEMGIDVLQK